MKKSVVKEIEGFIYGEVDTTSCLDRTDFVDTVIEIGDRMESLYRVKKSDLVLECEKIREEGVISDSSQDYYLETTGYLFLLSKMEETSEQSSKIEYLQKIMENYLEPTKVDEYFGLKKYINKYSKDINSINKILDFNDDNEWSKQLFIDENGNNKTKSQVKQRIKELHKKLNMDLDFEDSGTSFSRKEKRDNFFNDFSDKVGGIIGDKIKQMEYSGVSEYIFHNKDAINQEIKNLTSELELKSKEYKGRMQKEDFNKCKSQNEFFKGLVTERNKCGTPTSGEILVSTVRNFEKAFEKAIPVVVPMEIEEIKMQFIKNPIIICNNDSLVAEKPHMSMEVALEKMGYNNYEEAVAAESKKDIQESIVILNSNLKTPKVNQERIIKHKCIEVDDCVLKALGSTNGEIAYIKDNLSDNLLFPKKIKKGDFLREDGYVIEKNRVEKDFTLEKDLTLVEEVPKGVINKVRKAFKR